MDPIGGHCTGRVSELRSLEETYLQDPSDDNFNGLLAAYAHANNSLTMANGASCTSRVFGQCEDNQESLRLNGNLGAIERQRMMSILILSHEMRREMMGQERRRSHDLALAYPVNAMWNTGALAEASAKACADARSTLAFWQRPQSVIEACARLPEPWNSEYTKTHATKPAGIATSPKTS